MDANSMLKELDRKRDVALKRVRAEIEHVEGMTEEEMRQSGEEWESFKTIMNSERLVYPEEGLGRES